MNSNKKNRGQAMVLSTILLGGILLSASAIAGILMVYQIRQSNDAVSSAKAFFAADAGLEGATFCFLKGDRCPGAWDATNPPLNQFAGGEASFNVTLADNGTLMSITVKGLAKSAVRVLEAVFEL